MEGACLLSRSDGDACLASALHNIWLKSLGPKLRGSETHILRVGVGLRRVVRLLDAIQQELHIKVPATALLRLGTEASVLAAIRGKAWPPASALYLLRDGDDSPPLLIVSAGNGLILELCDLAQRIDYPGQIWGLQPPGLDGEAEPFTTIGDVADYYAKEITDAFPEGPYHLIGYSFGGLIAYETARRFAATGRKVGLIGLIDSNVCETYWPKRVWVQSVLAHALRRVVEARQKPIGQALSEIGHGVAKLFHYIGDKLGGKTTASVHRSVYYVGGLHPDFQRVRDSSIVAFERYRPMPLDLDVTLFKSKRGDPHACDPVRVWRRLVRRLDVSHVPGSHTTMVREPFVRALAAEIDARLT